MNGANSDNGVSIQKMVTPNMVGRNMVTPNMTSKIFNFSIFHFSFFFFFFKIGFSNHGALARVPEREWPRLEQVRVS